VHKKIQFDFFANSLYGTFRQQIRIWCHSKFHVCIPQCDEEFWRSNWLHLLHNWINGFHSPLQNTVVTNEKKLFLIFVQKTPFDDLIFKVPFISTIYNYNLHFERTFTTVLITTLRNIGNIKITVCRLQSRDSQKLVDWKTQNSCIGRF
jgi:hypothetical protein